jgi:Fe-Mn family superoxide dismutase
MFELKKLPYAHDALEPIISNETISYHYGKHHQGYVDNLNKLVKGTAYEDMSLEEIIRESSAQNRVRYQIDTGQTMLDTQALFNNAAQVYNHDLYWDSLRPEEPVGSGMSAQTEDRINRYYGSVDGLKETLKQAATKHFGSGWIWVCQHKDESLFVRATRDAETPIIDPLVTPLLVIDIWEHSYYLQYKNDRAKYIDEIFAILNWDRLVAKTEE